MFNTRTRLNSALMNVMTGAVLKAAKGLIRDFNEVSHLQVSKKGPGDFVSNADHRSEKTLYTELLKARPDFGFLMEEAGEIAGMDPRHRWIIDPLDGTTNFLHALPHFAISIALEYEGDILAGVVYDPIKDEMFCAEKGKGAFLNEHRLRVSSRRKLEEALVGVGRTSHKADVLFAQNLKTNIALLSSKAAGTRHCGASTLDLCYLAAGRFDAFVACDLGPWDLAAGYLIVREAGGYMDETTGKGSLSETGCVLATNESLRPEIRSVLGITDKSSTLSLFKYAEKKKEAQDPKQMSAEPEE